MGAYFASVALMLLVASEFSWRTARQNVIDGLSKEQFFLGKLMLLPMIGAVMFAVPLLVGPAIASLGEGFPAGAWMTPAQAQLAGAAALAMLGIMSLAFLFAMTIRSAGSAVGVFLLYLVFVERFGGAILGAIRDDWARAARYFPANVFGGLADPARWNPAAPAQAGDMAAVATPALLALGIGWILLLWLGSFLLFRRRDLWSARMTAHRLNPGQAAGSCRQLCRQNSAYSLLVRVSWRRRWFMRRRISNVPRARSISVSMRPAQLCSRTPPVPPSAEGGFDGRAEKLSCAALCT
jgi:ABC-2 type transport system permease protein